MAIKVNFFKRFSLEEILTVSMAFLLNVLIVIFSNFNKTFYIFLVNIGIIIIIAAVSYLTLYYFQNSKIISIIRDWYILPFILIIYVEHRYLIPLINPHDVDKYLIQIDRFLFFGNDPTVLLERFTYPVITELMQIVYESFYFLPIILCALLYKNKIKINFHITASTVIIGFYVTFIGYYLTPAIGPRFTLSGLQSFNLSGVLLFDFLRRLLDSMEGLTRDCCPSGHVLVPVLTILLSYRYHKPFFPMACIWSAIMLISTVYLRYHYVTDVIAGLIFALLIYRYVFDSILGFVTGRGERYVE